MILKNILKNSSNITDSFKVVTPDVSKIIGYNIYEEAKPFYLIEGFAFIVYPNRHTKKIYNIPKNFKSDGCTILKIFWIFLGCPHTPKLVLGSIVHDYFCDNKSLVDRNIASRCLLYLLLQAEVPKWKCYIMYFLVEIYQKYYNKWS